MGRKSALFAVVAIGAVLGLATPGHAIPSTGYGGKTFSAAMDGAQEVTASGVPNQGDLDGAGTAAVTVNVGRGSLCYSIAVTDITLPTTGAHVHVGPANTVGPVVVGLAAPGADGRSSGCVTAGEELLKAIQKNPSAYYVNVHTVDYPAGAVRGQLS